MTITTDDHAPPTPVDDAVRVPVISVPATSAIGPADVGVGSHLLRVASTIGWALVGFAVLVGVWQFGAWRVENLPSAGDTFTRLRHLVANAFYDGGPNDQGVGLLLTASLTRVFKGFGIGVLVGVPLGLAMGSSQRAWKAVNPIAQLLRPISPLAWYPILLIIFLDSAKASVWVICLTSLWPIVLNTAAGAASVPKDHRNVAKVFRLSRRSYVRHVVVPHTLPSTITGLRLSMGVAWMVIVAVEMMSGNTGIGNYVWTQYNAGDMAAVTSSIILIGATGLLLDTAFLRLGRLTTKQEAHA